MASTGYFPETGKLKQVLKTRTLLSAPGEARALIHLTFFFFFVFLAVTCPYNKFHQILPSRIQYHLVKCAKVRTSSQVCVAIITIFDLLSSLLQSHPNVELDVCPYNATHLIAKEDEKAHMHECPGLL